MLMAGRPSMPGTRHNSRDASGRRTLDGALQGSSAISEGARWRPRSSAAPLGEDTGFGARRGALGERRRGGDADERAACRRCTPRRHRHSARRTPQPAAPLMQPRAASASNGSGDMRSKQASRCAANTIAKHMRAHVSPAPSRSRWLGARAEPRRARDERIEGCRQAPRRWRGGWIRGLIGGCGYWAAGKSERQRQEERRGSRAADEGHR